MGMKHRLEPERIMRRSRRIFIQTPSNWSSLEEIIMDKGGTQGHCQVHSQAASKEGKEEEKKTAVFYGEEPC